MHGLSPPTAVPVQLQVIKSGLPVLFVYGFERYTSRILLRRWGGSLIIITVFCGHVTDLIRRGTRGKRLLVLSVSWCGKRQLVLTVSWCDSRQCVCVYYQPSVKWRNGRGGWVHGWVLISRVLWRSTRQFPFSIEWIYSQQPWWFFFRSSAGAAASILWYDFLNCFWCSRWGRGWRCVRPAMKERQPSHAIAVLLVHALFILFL